MYGVILEYAPGASTTALWRYRRLLARRPGYRRRLELQADGHRRLADLFLFATPEAAETALAGTIGQAGTGGAPRGGLALLVREGDARGLGPVVVLRRAPAGARDGDPAGWRDRFEPAAPAVELW
jgi:hypothetical protein